MTRDDVRRLLLARDPADPKEHADRDAMLGFLDELPEPFSREQAHAHFTASALVVDPARTRTALVHHRKLGIWVQPGGHLDAGDASYEGAALREVREETGLDGALLVTRARCPTSTLWAATDMCGRGSTRPGGQKRRRHARPLIASGKRSEAERARRQIASLP